MAKILPSSSMIKTIQAARRSSKLVFICGSGVSIAATKNESLSWPSLIREGFIFYRENKHDIYMQKKVDRYISDLENSKKISANKMLEYGSELYGLLGRNMFTSWFSRFFEELPIKNRDLIDEIAKFRAKIATTNYDDILEKGLSGNYKSITWKHEHSIRSWLGNLIEPNESFQRNSILHIHGSYELQDSVIITQKNYDDLKRIEFVRDSMKSLFSSNLVVFIGMGQGGDDPTFGLIKEWLRAQGSAHPHYVLALKQDIEDVKISLPEDCILVSPYGDSYGDLPAFLDSLNELTSLDRGSSEPVPPGSQMKKESTEQSRKYIDVPSLSSEANQSNPTTKATVLFSEKENSLPQQKKLSVMDYRRICLNAKSLFEDVIKFSSDIGLKEPERQIKNLAYRLNQNDLLFRVGFVGEQKAGKSTILNVMLGATVTPTNRKPATGTMISIEPSDSDDSYATIYFKDVAMNPLKKLVSEVSQISQLIEDYASKEHNKDNEKGVSHIIVRINTSQLVRNKSILDMGVSLVDLPGQGDSNPEMRSVTSEGINTLDAVLYIMNAADASIESNSFAVDDRCVSLVKQFENSNKVEKVLIVGNKSERLSHEDREFFKEEVIKELGPLGIGGDSITLSSSYGLQSGHLPHAREDSNSIERNKAAAAILFSDFETKLWERLLRNSEVGTRRIANLLRQIEVVFLKLDPVVILHATEAEVHSLEEALDGFKSKRKEIVHQLQIQNKPLLNELERRFANLQKPEVVSMLAALDGNENNEQAANLLHAELSPIFEQFGAMVRSGLQNAIEAQVVLEGAIRQIVNRLSSIDKNFKIKTLSSFISEVDDFPMQTQRMLRNLEKGIMLGGIAIPAVSAVLPILLSVPDPTFITQGLAALALCVAGIAKSVIQMKRRSSIKEWLEQAQIQMVNSLNDSLKAFTAELCTQNEIIASDIGSQIELRRELLQKSDSEKVSVLDNSYRDLRKKIIQLHDEILKISLSNSL